MTYKELDINKTEIANDTLGTLDSGLNGFFIWKWDEAATVETATKYIQFDFDFEVAFDFADPDFDYPDFLTQ